MIAARAIERNCQGKYGPIINTAFLAEYYLTHPCFICKEGRKNPFRCCGHRELEVIKAEMIWMERVTRKPMQREFGYTRATEVRTVGECG